MSAKPRNVTPIISWIRNTLSGRKLKSVHRFDGEMSPRSPPLPVLPEGPSHQLAQNWYCDRDGRRKAEPPMNAFQRKALPSGTEAPAKDAPAVAAKASPPKPGFGYDWTTSQPKFTSWTFYCILFNWRLSTVGRCNVEDYRWWIRLTTLNFLNDEIVSAIIIWDGDFEFYDVDIPFDITSALLNVSVEWRNRLGDKWE